MRFGKTGTLLITLAILLATACAPAGSPTPTVPGATPTPLAAIGDVARGEELFKKTCAECHSRPGMMPEDLATLSPKQIRQTVRQGKNGAMPSFSESELSDQDLNDIIAYIKSLEH
ncbi:MAG: c-type cytochrome [Chloroflexota bacterium]